MGFMSRLFGISETKAIEETHPELPDTTRAGFEFGVPMGGTSDHQRARAAGSTRRQVMDELYQAYLACPWVSTCADTVARKVTAGGIVLVPDDGDADQTRPWEIQQLDALLAQANDREDGIQLFRSTVTDLMVFGDGFLEIGDVAGLIAALWTLDSTTMSVGTDEHGVLSAYYQDVDNGRTATFEPDEVIHISLDSPRGGVYGVSPTQKLLVTITTWLFAAACLKEYYRRGMPRDIAVDLGKDTTPTEGERWRQEYNTGNLGPRNIGQPMITRLASPGIPAVPPVKEMSLNQIQQLLETMEKCRDEIISGFGLSPAEVGIIESGNLGSGSGEAQAKATHYGTVVPVQNILLEKLNYTLLTVRGIQGWHFEFGEVDYRDSKTIEEIRDTRLRNGSITLNVLRAELGEKPVEGGDEPVLVDRQNLVLWRDLADFSKALVASKDPASKQPPAVPGAVPQGGGTAPVPDPDKDPNKDPDGQPREHAAAYRTRKLDEAWTKSFEAQRARANRELKDVDA